MVILLVFIDIWHVKFFLKTLIMISIFTNIHRPYVYDHLGPIYLTRGRSEASKIRRERERERGSEISVTKRENREREREVSENRRGAGYS